MTGAVPTGGKFEFDDGGSYCGGWEDGKAHGHGICTGPQGQGQYEGAWNLGFEKSGTYTWPSGNVYAGEWSSGKRQGLGEEIKGKWIYRGEWTHGFKGRYGLRQSTSSGAVYAGTWTTGLQDGYGVETYVDGGTYRGQWLQSMRHGFGVRQSVPYGLAVRYRSKTPTLFQQSSKSSVLTSSDNEEGLNSNDVTIRRRDRRVDNDRGGFVLLGHYEPTRHRDGGTGSGSSSGSGESRLRRTLARLKKQRSTGDMSPSSLPGTTSLSTRVSPGMPRHRTPDGSVRSQRASSEELEDRESIHTDSCNASFISQDDMRGCGTIDVGIVEKYAGEWKNDKRSGYGVCERNDGLKYEGEWFNNKKNGYGVTTFPDGSVEEGKYKENELVAGLTPTDKSTAPHLFTMKQTKLRERINAAVSEAINAAHIAHQKADIGSSRETQAKQRAELAVTAANKARADAEIARQMAAQYQNIPLNLELLQSLTNTNKPPSEAGGASTAKSESAAEAADRRQSRSLSLFTRAFGKGTDSRRPSTVAAVFHAATNTIRQTPARLSRRASAIIDNVTGLSGDRKSTAANSVTWKQSNDWLSNDYSDDEILRRDDRQAVDMMTSRLNHVDQRQGQIENSDDRYYQRMMNRNENNNNVAGMDSTYDADRTRAPPSSNPHRYSSDEDEPAGPRRNLDRQRYSHYQHQRKYSSDERSSNDRQLQPQQQRQLTSEDDLDSEERDYCAPTLPPSANMTRHHRTRSAERGPGGSASQRSNYSNDGQRSATSGGTSSAGNAELSAVHQRGPRRLTLPSIVKYPDLSIAGKSSQSGSGNSATGGHVDKPDTYVIINGERHRITLTTGNDSDLMSGTARTSSDSAAHDGNSSSDDVTGKLPNRYALEPIGASSMAGRRALPSRLPLSPAAAEGGRSASRNRGSMPDVSSKILYGGGTGSGSSAVTTAGVMSREEVHYLSQKRREDLRRLREEEERRRKFEVILSLGTLREWSSQRQLLIIVIAINVSLAAVFWNLLRHS